MNAEDCQRRVDPFLDDHVAAVIPAVLALDLSRHSPGRRRADDRDERKRRVCDQLAYSRHRLGSEDRVATESEEVSVRIDVWDIKYLSPDCAHAFLEEGARHDGRWRLLNHLELPCKTRALNLPRGAGGDLGHDHDPPRDLERRNGLGHEVLEGTLVHGMSLPNDDGGSDLLAEADVRHAEGRGLLDGRMTKQDLVHFQGRDLLPGSVDDLLQATDEKQVAIAVESTQVPCAEPTVREGHCVGFWIRLVSCENSASADGDLADIALVGNAACR